MAHATRSHALRFEPLGRETTALAGDTILDVAARVGLNLAADCGGRGVCGACRVVVEGAASPGPSRRRLDPESLAAGARLACLTPVKADLVVHLSRRFQPAAEEGFGARLAPVAEMLPLVIPPDGPLPDVDTLRSALGGDRPDADPIVVDPDLLPQIEEARVAGSGRTRALLVRAGGVRRLDRVEAGAASLRTFGVAARVHATGVIAELVQLGSGRVVVGVEPEHADLVSCVDDLVRAHGFDPGGVIAVSVVSDERPGALGTSADGELPRAESLALAVHPAAPVLWLGPSVHGASADLLAGAVAAGIGDGRRSRSTLYVDARDEGGHVLAWNDRAVASPFVAAVGPAGSLEVVLERAGLAPGDLGEVALGGGLGQDVDFDALVAAGWLPDLDRDRVRYLVEDSAVQGARATLVSDGARLAQQRLSNVLEWVHVVGGDE